MHVISSSSPNPMATPLGLIICSSCCLVSSYQLSLDEYNGDRILLDLVEQALSFAINHGLPGREICFFLSFYISALDLLAGNSEGLQNIVSCMLLTGLSGLPVLYAG